jgi:hypothetical protein
MRLELSCDGAQQTSRRLRNMGTRSLDQSSVMSAAARDTAHAIEGVPEDTGRLARSVRDGAAETARRVNDDLQRVTL